jgi:putative transcriptional regulator
MDNRIKEYRKAFNYTQAELGKMLGTSGANVSSWEVGRTEPTVNQAVKMAQIFGCSVPDLFGFGEDYKRMVRLTTYAKKLGSLPESAQEAVMQLIDNLLNGIDSAMKMGDDIVFDNRKEK